jgi:hypothetical protein
LIRAWIEETKCPQKFSLFSEKACKRVKSMGYEWKIPSFSAKPDLTERQAGRKDVHGPVQHEAARLWSRFVRELFMAKIRFFSCSRSI